MVGYDCGKCGEIIDPGDGHTCDPPKIIHDLRRRDAIARRAARKMRTMIRFKQMEPRAEFDAFIDEFCRPTDR